MWGTVTSKLLFTTRSRGTTTSTGVTLILEGMKVHWSPPLVWRLGQVSALCQKHVCRCPSVTTCQAKGHDWCSIWPRQCTHVANSNLLTRQHQSIIDTDWSRLSAWSHWLELIICIITLTGADYQHDHTDWKWLAAWSIWLEMIICMITLAGEDYLHVHTDWKLLGAWSQLLD